MLPFDSRDREAGDAEFVPPSICDQVRFGGMMDSHWQRPNLKGHSR
jgi:hypothetical protein